MAQEVILPKVDMDMTEGKIAHWHVRNGDPVRKGQVVFEIETDKATMEIEATADGVMQGSDGVTDVLLPVGQVVAWIVQPGEAVPSVGAALATQTGADAPATGPVEVDRPAPAGPAEADPQHLLRATPLARSIARSRGIDLHLVQGSGPAGRVLARDLPAQVALVGSVVSAAETGSEPLHLHWFRRRAGVPLVLLHGFGTSSGSWRPLAQQLGDDVPVLGIDLPSHGKSPRANVQDLDTVARMLLQRLDQEGITALHLVGHSMGGGAALALVPMLRQRLRSLTLLAPLGLGPQINGAFIQGILRTTRAASLRPWLVMMFGDPAQLSSSFAASAWSELEAPDTRAALATMADQLLPDGTQACLLREHLTELTMPVKLIWGVLDRIVPPSHAAAVPGAVAVHLLQGVGHLPQIEATPLLAMLLRQQLAAGDAATPKLAQFSASAGRP